MRALTKACGSMYALRPKTDIRQRIERVCLCDKRRPSALWGDREEKRSPGVFCAAGGGESKIEAKGNKGERDVRGIQNRGGGIESLSLQRFFV